MKPTFLQCSLHQHSSHLHKNLHSNQPPGKDFYILHSSTVTVHTHCKYFHTIVCNCMFTQLVTINSKCLQKLQFRLIVFVFRLIPGFSIHFDTFPDISSHVHPFPGIAEHFQSFPDVSSHCKPFQAISGNALPLSAISCNFQSLLANSSHFRPFPFISSYLTDPV